MRPEFYHLPYPNPYHGVTLELHARRSSSCSKADVDPARVAAIIIDRCWGCGFTRRRRNFCVVCAACRQPLYLADRRLAPERISAAPGSCSPSSTPGLRPDLITIAKSVAGVVPLFGRPPSKPNINDAPGPGRARRTFAGSPLLARCPRGTRVMREEHLMRRAHENRRFMARALRGCRCAFPCVGVRARSRRHCGPIELVKTGRAESPDAELTKSLVSPPSARAVILSCWVYSNVIRSSRRSHPLHAPQGSCHLFRLALERWREAGVSGTAVDSPAPAASRARRALTLGPSLASVGVLKYSLSKPAAPRKAVGVRGGGGDLCKAAAAAA